MYTPNPGRLNLPAAKNPDLSVVGEVIGQAMRKRKLKQIDETRKPHQKEAHEKQQDTYAESHQQRILDNPEIQEIGRNEAARHLKETAGEFATGGEELTQERITQADEIGRQAMDDEVQRRSEENPYERKEFRFSRARVFTQGTRDALVDIYGGDLVDLYEGDVRSLQRGNILAAQQAKQMGAQTTYMLGDLVGQMQAVPIEQRISLFQEQVNLMADGQLKDVFLNAQEKWFRGQDNQYEATDDTLTKLAFHIDQGLKALTKENNSDSVLSGTKEAKVILELQRNLEKDADLYGDPENDDEDLKEQAKFIYSISSAVGRLQQIDLKDFGRGYNLLLTARQQVQSNNLTSAEATLREFDAIISRNNDSDYSPQPAQNGGAGSGAEIPQATTPETGTGSGNTAWWQRGNSNAATGAGLNSAVANGSVNIASPIVTGAQQQPNTYKEYIESLNPSSARRAERYENSEGDQYTPHAPSQGDNTDAPVGNEYQNSHGDNYTPYTPNQGDNTDKPRVEPYQDKILRGVRNQKVVEPTKKQNDNKFKAVPYYPPTNPEDQIRWKKIPKVKLKPKYHRTLFSPPRGLSLNNPGNIKKGNDWKGIASKQEDSVFDTFNTPEDGIRAMVKVLKSYKTKHGLDTIKGIVSRYAPSSENDTNAYVKRVANSMKIAENEKLNLSDRNQMLSFIKSIIQVEQGMQPFTDATLIKGIVLA